MLKWIQNKIIGTKNERDVRKLRPFVQQINELEEGLQSLSDEQLQAKTEEFRARLRSGEQIDDLMCEAFAVVKNACRRLVGRSWPVTGNEITWDMVPFDVQLIGGIALHQGKIAEMATGEGKTLVATMPLYLNALTGNNVRLVTVNDYLAKRDSEWMGGVFKFLGLTIGCIQHDQPPEIRRAQYECDITYGTNSEFGFDYLRDNGMARSKETQVQKGHFYAIVDEIDSILIDEARTPLIISGPSTVSAEQYEKFKPAVQRLYREQMNFCNKLTAEAKKLLEQDEPDEYTAGRLLFQVSQGMPKHKQLQHMIEDPRIRKLLSRTEGEVMTQDQRKIEFHRLKEDLYFTIDEKGSDSDLTEKGRNFLHPDDPEAFVLPDLINDFHDIDQDESLSPEEKAKRKAKVQEAFDQKGEAIHNIAQLLRAYCVFEKDVQYVVQDNEVLIVDEFTGRLMPGRRYSDGLHQALEAKEGVRIQRPTQTLATITIQNYFRLYEKLAGMTGTAETEADEFHQIYKLDVMVIPTNRPCRREDYNDLVYKTRREKYNAIIDEIIEAHKEGQPVLVGTASVDASEVLSRLLRRRNIPHSVLNAKYHQREAEIISMAGQRGAVTIATNMAGRGTDIKLGPGVEALGGLFVIGSERHEARRIDRQLRGRCARQGDRGTTRFYVSLEDDLMRLFGSDKIATLMEKVGLEEGEPIEHRLLNRSIESAQKRVEQHNFSIRKRTLEYDDVMNKQREVIYDLRNSLLDSEDPREQLFEYVDDTIFRKISGFLGSKEEPLTEPDIKGLLGWCALTFPIGLKEADLYESEGKLLAPDTVADMICEKVRKAYAIKVSIENPEALRYLERLTVLNAIDRLWQEHLYNMDSLRQGVGLRSYGQRDPLIEYKNEAFDMFSELVDSIQNEVATNLFRSASSVMAMEQFLRNLPQNLVHQDAQSMGGAQPAQAGGGSAPTPPHGPAPSGAAASMVDRALSQSPVRRDVAKVGRNDPCPCGSGKKYKKCCGKAE
ncbi:MAG: preprotein translocase subunit SecA [Verrucomicrobiota bacterium]|nr:preprotein translocase subunit SecA [Verrucomicrobiota bacterium]